jgi:hypothetical protein
MQSHAIPQIYLSSSMEVVSYQLTKVCDKLRVIALSVPLPISIRAPSRPEIKSTRITGEDWKRCSSEMTTKSIPKPLQHFAVEKTQA